MARRRRTLLGHKRRLVVTPVPSARSAAPSSEDAAQSPEPAEAAPPEDEAPEPAEPAPPDAAPPEPEPAPVDDAPDASAPPDDADDEAPWNPYRTAGMEEALQEIDEGFDDLGERPPTEEFGAGLYEDYTTPYSAPVHVPEPPPLPGLGDRFTPPPVQRTPVGAHQTQNRPSYLAEPTPVPAQQRVADFTTYEEELRRLREEEQQQPEQKGPPAFVLALVGVAVVLLVMLVVSAIAMMPSEDGVEAAGRAAGIVERQVEVRADMRQSPGLIGTGSEPFEPPEPIDDDAPPEGEDEEGAASASSEAPAPPPAAAGGAAPAPRASAPARRPASAPPEADRATLRIRSNRRVLVYLNDRAVGYTPQDHEVAPGVHRISAMLPGQPETRQDVEVELTEPEAVEPVDFRF